MHGHTLVVVLLALLPAATSLIPAQRQQRQRQQQHTPRRAHGRAAAAAACAHCVLMAPWNMDDRHDLDQPGIGPANWTNLDFDTQFTAWGAHYNDSSQPLSASSVRGAYLNKQIVGVSNLLRADHIFWSWLAHDDSAPGSCVWPGHSMMCANWRERWLSVVKALKPFIANGTYEGVFMGDELMDSGLPLSNLSSAVSLVRATWPEAVIYVNEGVSSARSYPTSLSSCPD